MSEVYESLIAGLNEAIAFASGKDTGAVVHAIAVPTVDVAKIRANTGLSQSAFAKSIGVAKGTLLNWEQGRREPEGPAKVLLRVAAKHPEALLSIAQAPGRTRRKKTAA